MANTPFLARHGLSVNGYFTVSASNGQWSVGANVVANTTTVFVGNSTVNAYISSTGLTVGSTFIGSANTTLAGNLFTVGSTLYVTTGGNTGIKNTAPTTALQVDGNFSTKISSLGTSNTLSCNLALGNYFTATCNGTTSVAFTNAPGSVLFSFALLLSNTGTISWSNTVAWPANTAPSSSGNKDLYLFYTENGGTTYRGQQIVKDYRS